MALNNRQRTVATLDKEIPMLVQLWGKRDAQHQCGDVADGFPKVASVIGHLPSWRQTISGIFGGTLLLFAAQFS
jgi:hypothetical protein